MCLFFLEFRARSHSWTLPDLLEAPDTKNKLKLKATYTMCTQGTKVIASFFCYPYEPSLSHKHLQIWKTALLHAAVLVFAYQVSIINEVKKRTGVTRTTRSMLSTAEYVIWRSETRSKSLAVMIGYVALFHFIPASIRLNLYIAWKASRDIAVSATVLPKLSFVTNGYSAWK
jgi:TRAP-type uncharacterized transport system fused permease subunit